ncbi:DUF2804 family protein [Nocardioides sp. Bht2]|uniref:DUF2804 family protein n=1 Tax=Nocardioides sp. Bht2 TaxID=3392297 RepID=UPI0039B6E6E0
MIFTPWGEELDPDQVLPEHPRPQLVRQDWLNLNGRWDYAITPADRQEAPARFDGEIVVPFSPEAPLSGVGRVLQPDQALWYRRTLRLGSAMARRGRLLLHFGAVDQRCEVWVDGTSVGTHLGGYLPFSFDITDALRNVVDHEVVVRVRDVTDTSWHARGKQKLKSGGIWYSPQSGIWQTVWLERVPTRWITKLDHTAGLDGRPGAWRGRLTFTVQTSGDAGEAIVKVRDGHDVVASGSGRAGEPITLEIANARPWSPDDPHLYDVEVVAGEDRVASYAAIRTVGTARDPQGRTRFTLNGEPILHAGLLDQGYWPDGLLTAPHDDALVFDIQTAKDLGFTLLRKHIKVEPLRWYYHCDRLGMLVWQDMVNGGRSYQHAIVTTPVLAPIRIDDRRHRLFGRQDAAGRAEFRAEVDRTVELLRSTPSVVAWVPFNEGWGQFDAAAVTEQIRALDPTRPIDATSGWHDQGAGDMASRHVYFKPYKLSATDAADDRVAVLSEYGGYSHRVAGHCWSEAECGYRRIAARDQFERAFRDLQQRQVRPAIADGLAGFVYTQLSDVESESNGLITYDRRVVKVDAAAIRASNAGLRSEFDRAVGRVPAPVTVAERELVAPVSLTLPDGHLNPAAIGWCRTPMVRTDGIGAGTTGKGRNKRWEYWAITTPTHVVAVVLSDIDYAGVSGLWVLDRATRTPIAVDVITPFGSGVELPGTLGEGVARLRSKKLNIEIEEIDGGTALRVTADRVRVEVVAQRPVGHESLGVVVPWTERLFQYTVKDVARPAVGSLWIDGVEHRLLAGESWATLDHGRGRWPHAMHWNWGAGSGLSHGRRVGIQVGGRWTDGTGSVENSLLVDGRLHKISDELVWTYDTQDWLAPWRVHGHDVDLTFTPEYDKVSVTDFKVLSSRTHQCFGTWSGHIHLGGGSWVVFADLFGWAEDVHQRW